MTRHVFTGVGYASTLAEGSSQLLSKVQMLWDSKAGQVGQSPPFQLRLTSVELDIRLITTWDGRGVLSRQPMLGLSELL